jgi:putative nucleotidyltransferase with HDIG domain
MGRHKSSDELYRLPVQPVVAARLMRFFGDGIRSSAELGRIVESDPALSARVVRLASAPYYGVSGRVASAARAVVLLGVSTTQAVAARAVWDLADDGITDGLPPGYFAHALATAAATSAVAARVGLPESDTFTLGLLHDVGHLYPASSGSSSTTDDDHARVGADRLSAWGFPPSFVRAVAGHHGQPEEALETLTRVLIAGHVLGRMLGPSEWDEPDDVKLPDALRAVGLHVGVARDLLAVAERELAKRADLLEVGG